jgi:hypothetical protein
MIATWTPPALRRTSAASRLTMTRRPRESLLASAGMLYGRGLAKARKGDRNGGTANIATAKAIKSDIADEFARYGLK